MSTENAAVTETDAATKMETKAETKTSPKSAKAKRPKEPKEPVIYLGPSIKGIANHCDVYSDEVDSLFADRINAMPVLKSLLFPISEGGKKMAELKQGGPVSKLYEAAEQKLKEVENDGKL